MRLTCINGHSFHSEQINDMCPRCGEPGSVTGRRTVDQADIDAMCLEFRKQLLRRLDRKGNGCFMSRHEVLGCVAEEYFELTGAVHQGELKDVRWECWDVSVAAAFGAISIDKGVEW